MEYYPVKQCVQVLFEQLVPLSDPQNRHLSECCLAMLEAGTPQLSRIACELNHATSQASRMQWIRRVLDASYLSQEPVYQPFIRHLLSSYKTDCLHLIIDRTDFKAHERDLLSLNLSFRRRAIPIGWCWMPHGSSGSEQQIALLEQCLPLIPAQQRVVFHGDNEFGSVALMRYLQFLNWDFILAQSASTHYLPSLFSDSYPLSSLPVTSRSPLYLSDILLTKQHRFGPVNLFAFFHPVVCRNRPRQSIRFFASSLPLTPHLRRVGRRRWGIECFFKDLKSAGWHLPSSRLSSQNRLESLLILFNFAYSWLTCLGRWLSKSSQRHFVDSYSQRHFSFFRIGWQWLVYTLRIGGFCPLLTTLYS